MRIIASLRSQEASRREAVRENNWFHVGDANTVRHGTILRHSGSSLCINLYLQIILGKHTSAAINIEL